MLKRDCRPWFIQVLLLLLFIAPAIAGQVNSQPGKKAAKSSNSAKIKTEPNTVVSDTVANGVDGKPKFGKVPSKFLSIANEAPGLLVYFNDAQSVYGLPGSNDDPDFFKRNHASGDWGGLRTKLAEKGIFLDLYTVSNYAEIRKGLGNKNLFIQNMQYTANIDTGRLGLWPGAIIHITAQEREGSKVSNQYNTGASSSYYANTLIPVIGQNSFHFDEYYIYQQFTQNFSVLVGKIPPLFLPDQTMFASSSKQDFANFNFGGANPMYTDYYNTTSWVGLAFLKFNDNLTVITGALDPSSIATNFAKHAFDHTNLFAQANISYNFNGLPGQLVPAINWFNKPTTDYRYLRRHGGDKNTRSSLMLAINTSQYLYLIDPPKEVERKLSTGEVVRGFGIIARGGWGPEKSNFISSHANIAFYGAGLWDERPADRFGIGIYYNGINKNLRKVYNDKPNKKYKLKNESGMEVFYNLGITPAISWTNSYTYIRHPTYAEMEQKNHSSNVFMSRLAITW